MKKSIFTLTTSLFCLFVNAQTAPSFTANDCASNSHDLYAELNSGKIIVITWVMPCGSCIGGATAAQNAVLSFSTSNPGQVLHYIADDVANTTCTSLGSWCTTNSLNPDAKFSSSSVNQTGYGAAGMPKVVVLGNTSHTIYYNVNGGSVTQTNITNAINNSLAVQATGIKESSFNDFQARILPNPVSNELKLTFNLIDAKEMNIEIFNSLGQKVKTVSNPTVNGNNEMNINVEDLSAGNYFVKLNNGKSSTSVKFIISR